MNKNKTYFEHIGNIDMIFLETFNYSKPANTYGTLKTYINPLGEGTYSHVSHEFRRITNYNLLP